jgi:hypothetical protein
LDILPAPLVEAYLLESEPRVALLVDEYQQV